MAEKPADSARGARRSDSAADGALTQPTVELKALPGGRPPGPAVPDAPTVEQPTVEQPIVQLSADANRSADAFDEPTVEQPVVRPAAVRPAAAAVAGLTAAPAQPPTGPAGTASGPAATAPAPSRSAPPDEPDRFIALARRYGWVVAAGSVAAVALLCSAPFVSGNGLLWNPASSTGSPTTPTATPESAPTATVTAEVTDTSPAAGDNGESPEVRQADPPAVPPEQPASDPAPPPPPSDDPPASSAAPPGGGEPVLLGPDNSDDLRGMLDSYCKQEHGGGWMAWPREWPGNGTEWECVRPWTPHDRDLDVRRACASRYGEPVVAEAGSRRDAYSWRCYRG
ncbi:hypothetical protein [Solwaraspora sp. WMMA2065]|uniref:hypothetical protein n=1 Tax=Solwaraspora sp. WMMA2065 TaxID=3015166 RepID=UPI00259BAAE1|nr:hypothetical protein [Solwaraspora sp. WMMA2065]WJK36477.1 hypothetical protein O7610_09065 [Solwaraspora sp. WMMA2065]